MDLAPAGDSALSTRPRALLLADETILSMGLIDLLKERVELMILDVHQPAEQTIAAIAEWQPEVILLTSSLASSFPCPWQWMPLLERKGICLIRLALQDNTIGMCHVQTITIAHLEDLVRLIAQETQHYTLSKDMDVPGRQ